MFGQNFYSENTNFVTFCYIFQVLSETWSYWILITVEVEKKRLLILIWNWRKPKAFGVF